MMRIATNVLGLLSALLVGFVNVGVFAADPEPPTLGKSFSSDAVRFVAAFSEDHQTSTLIFDNFSLATASGKGQLLSAETKSFTLGNKIDTKDAVSVTLDIRGFVSTQEGGTAALIVHVGQETTVVDLPRAIAAATSKPRKAEDPVYAQAVSDAERSGFNATTPSTKNDNFSTRITTSLVKGQPLQATVLLLVDRLPDADSSALITVDSIDIAVKAAPVPKKTESKGESSKVTEASEKPAAEPRTNVKKVAARKSPEKKADKDEDTKSVASKSVTTSKSAAKETETESSPKKAAKEKSESKTAEKKAAETKKSDE